MALVLGLKLHKVFYAGDTPITVSHIQDARAFTVTVGGVDILIGSEEVTAVLPHVGLKAGRGTANLARLIIKAPRSIPILREDLYQ